MTVATLMDDDFVLPHPAAERLLLSNIGIVKFQVSWPNKKFGLIRIEDGTVYYRGDAVYRWKFNGTPNPVLTRHKTPLTSGQHVTLDVQERRNPSSPSERFYSTRVVIWEPEAILQLIERMENLPIYRFLRITDDGEQVLWCGQDLTEFRATYPKQAFQSGWLADYRFERYSPDTDDWSESAPIYNPN